MWPVICTVGPVTIYTLGVSMAIGFILMIFLAWRRLKDMGLEEEKIVDFLLLFSLLGFIFSRAGYILTNFSQFGFSVKRWLFFGRFSGFSPWGVIVGGALTLLWFSHKQKWSLWKVADETIFGLLPFLILVRVGQFLDGCTPGAMTGMPWGVFGPGDFLRRQPVALFEAVIVFCLWVVLIQIERRWRTWSWLKKINDGFVTWLFLAVTLTASFTFAFFEEGGVYYLWIKRGLSLGCFLLVAVWLGLRVEWKTVFKRRG